MIYGKYTIYVFLSYGAAFVLISALVYHVKWILKQAQHQCRSAFSKHKDAPSS